MTTSTCRDGHILPHSAKGCLQHLATRNQVAAVSRFIGAQSTAADQNVEVGPKQPTSGLRESAMLHQNAMVTSK